MVCLYTVFHNSVRIHKTLKCSPAMAAGLSNTLWSMGDLVAMIYAVAETAEAATSLQGPATEEAVSGY